jgi:hypothetical protein
MVVHPQATSDGSVQGGEREGGLATGISAHLASCSVEKRTLDPTTELSRVTSLWA